MYQIVQELSEESNKALALIEDRGLDFLGDPTGIRTRVTGVRIHLS